MIEMNERPTKRGKNGIGWETHSLAIYCAHLTERESVGLFFCLHLYSEVAMLTEATVCLIGEENWGNG